MQAEANRTTQIRNDARNSGLSPAWKGGLFHLSAGTRQEVDCSALGRGGLLAPETLASREWIFYGGSPCRKEMWRKLGGYRAEYSYDTQDLDFWMRAMTGGFKGYYSGRVIYEWRRSSTGMNERTSPASRVRTRVHNIAFYDRFGDGAVAPAAPSVAAGSLHPGRSAAGHSRRPRTVAARAAPAAPVARSIHEGS